MSQKINNLTHAANLKLQQTFKYKHKQNIEDQ